MKIRCNYCRGFMEDSDSVCPNCGATNTNMRRTAIDSPKTIEELKAWYEYHNLPPANVTRFFIGENVSFARAYGIYKDETNNFVVYKNKDDGTRAVRYTGQDEEYAVNEIYTKLKEEIIKRKNAKSSKNVSTSYKKMGDTLTFIATTIITLVIMGIIFMAIWFSTFGSVNKNGYYKYHNDIYYRQGSSWYEYDDGWYYTSDIPYDLRDNYSDYYESYYYNDEYNTSDFSNTSYYQSYHSSSSSSSSSDSWSSSWDDDYDWDDDDDWDSSDSDWDSDW